LKRFPAFLFLVKRGKFGENVEKPLQTSEIFHLKKAGIASKNYDESRSYIKWWGECFQGKLKHSALAPNVSQQRPKLLSTFLLAGFLALSFVSSDS
jgi:hypothetical protein